jgi:hypothetical protein
MDHDGKQHVNEEQMYREIQKYVNDGWKVELFGETFTRGILLTREQRRQNGLEQLLSA